MMARPADPAGPVLTGYLAPERSVVGDEHDLARRRRDYGRAALHESDVAADPLTQLRRWLDEAIAVEPGEPTAMTLATVDDHGRPSARTVLLKRLDSGLVFVTNLASRKSRELDGNPYAAALLRWDELERQVEVNGRTARLADAEADALFAARPRAAQLAAWASAQSQPVTDRAELDRAVTSAQGRFEGREVPRPPHWGGWRIEPTRVELWQGRPGRLHDRLCYRPHGHGWALERLAP